MHKIITSGKKNSFGEKADGLIRLDKFGLTPDFVLISIEFLKEETYFPEGSSEYDGRVCFTETFLKTISDNISFLGGGPYIVRSSAIGEDSCRSSYAGIFLSEIAYKREDIFQKIEKVYLSNFSTRSTKYRHLKQEKSTEMGIIIQKYISPDFSGIFFYDSEKDVGYAEFADGGCDKIVSGEIIPFCSLILGKECFFSTVELRDKYLRFIKDCRDKINVLSLENKFSKTDIEFCVKNGAVHILQCRPVTANIPKGGRFIFPYSSKEYLFSQDVVDLNYLHSILSRLDFYDIRIICGKDKIFYSDAEELERFFYQMRKKAAEPGFVDKFTNLVMSSFMKEFSCLKNLINENKRIVIDKYKMFNYHHSIMELISRNLLKYFEDIEMKKHGLEWWNNNAFRYADKISFMSKKMLKAKSQNKLAKIMELFNKDFKKNISFMSLKDNSSDDNDMFFSDCYYEISSLIRLKDKVNYYYGLISGLYNKLLLSGSRSNVDVGKLLNRDSEQILSVLINENNLNIVDSPKNKPEKQEEEISSSNQSCLFGFTASPGNVSGKAVVIYDKESDFESIDRVDKDSILVVKQTTPNLVLAMGLCAGIVSEQGGMLCHAAIVSRELNKPCLVGVNGCVTKIMDGDIVEIDHNCLKIIERKNHWP